VPFSLPLTHQNHHELVLFVKGEEARKEIFRAKRKKIVR
jgi:hypothetical protein